MAGVITALAFLTTLFAPDQLTQQQRLLGIIALTAFWERYLRDFFHSLGQEIDNRIGD